MNEALPLAEFTATVSPSVYSSASFYRTGTNSSIVLSIPLGTEAPAGIFSSSNVYLATNTFNSVENANGIAFLSNKDAKIYNTRLYAHDVLIQFKLTKSDDSNFSNQRELRCSLVKEDGITLYNSNIFANQQINSNTHDCMQLKARVTHAAEDLVRIKFQVIQDNQNADQSETKLIIFRINWTITGL